MTLTETLSNHDVGRGRGGVAAALRSCPVPTVVGGITSDRLYPLRLQQELADLLPNCTGLNVVESIRGHFDPMADPEASNVGACVLNLACAVAARFGLDLPGESGGWLCTPAKLTLAGVSEPDLDECANRARAHYVLLCASVV